MKDEKDNEAYAPTTPVGRPTPPTAKGDPALQGRRIGVYDIIEQIGKGGMGAVYRARDLSLDRDVALKVLLPELAADHEFEQRFVREARASAKLDHPNIVSVYTAGRFENVLFIAMQYVQGRTLHDLIKERGRIPVGEALDIIRQAAEALDAAHKIDLIHRDIKPNNIMITPEGRVKIMDFGLMRSIRRPDGITQTGVFYGTPEYASPEQCETGVLDGRSDIYSLGAVFYEMLTGRMPHIADTPLALFKKITEEDPLPIRSLSPEVPPAVEGMVRKMLSRKREERFASAGELAEAIRQVQGGKKMSFAPASAPKRRLWIAAAAAALLIVTGVGLTIHFAGKKSEPSRNNQQPTTAGSTADASANPPAPEKISLVVFDFVSMHKTPENEWLEVAIPDMLVTWLSMFPQLQVPTRDQLLWKLRDLSLAERITDDNRRVLINEFHAQVYLTGSYLAQGGTVQVTLNGYRLPGNEKAFAPKVVSGKEEQISDLIKQLSDAVNGGLREAGALTTAFAAPKTSEADYLAMNLGGRSDRRQSRPEAEKKLDEKQRSLEPAESARKESPKPGSDKSAAKDDMELAQAQKGGDGRARAGEYGGAEKNKKAEAGGEEKRKAADKLFKSMSRGELVKSWYTNQRTVERSGLDPEEIQALLKKLHAQYEVEDVDVQHFQAGLDDMNKCLKEFCEQKKTSGLRLDKDSMIFECPGCHGQSHEFGKCDRCDCYVVLKIKVPPKKADAPAKEEKK